MILQVRISDVVKLSAKSVELYIHIVIIIIIIYILADIHDHSGVSGDLVFPTCISERCIRIPIIDDMMVEQRESFFVSLQKPDEVDNRIKIDRDSARKEVIILDNDGKYYCWYVQVNTQIREFC